MNTLLTLAQVRYINQLTKKHNSLIDRINFINNNNNWDRFSLRYVLSFTKTPNNFSYKELVTRLNDCIKNAEEKLIKLLPEAKKREEQQRFIALCNETPLEGYQFTLNQIRYIFNLTDKNSINLRDFLETIDLDFEEAVNLLNDIWQDQLTWEQYQDNEYFKHEYSFYSDDYYVLTMEGEIEDRDHAAWCEDSDEWTSDPVILRDGREERTIARSVAERNYYECSWDNDFYYSQDGIEYYGYYLNDDGEVTDEPPHDEYVREYHSNTSPTFVIFNDNNPYRIGFEIEKEDNYIKESINIDDFEYETNNKWRKEEDGSLSDYSGYELVSPCFSLDPDSIREYIEDNNILVDHINADYSDRCGGHINLSKKDLTGEQFYETIKGYTPLIHALNYDRLGESYCTPASVDKLKADKRKYQSIAIWSNRIELRVFSAVENVDQLIWRAELMKLITDNPTDCFKTAFYNVHTILKAHLEEGFNNEYFNSDNHYDDYQEFIDEIITQCKKYENIDLA